MKKIILIFLFLFLNLSGCDRSNQDSTSSKDYSTEKEKENTDTSLKIIFEGSNEAKINLIVYESLTCSHCATFHEKIYPKIKKEFVDKGIVKIEFRHFPLDLAAFNASKIAQCKNDGKPDILNLLFANQSKWAKGETVEEFNANIKKLIKEKNINLNFEKCINNKKIEDFVLNSRIEGSKKFEVNSTPTIIINNKKFDKPLNFKNIKKTIEKLI